MSASALLSNLETLLCVHSSFSASSCCERPARVRRTVSALISFRADRRFSNSSTKAWSSERSRTMSETLLCWVRFFIGFLSFLPEFSHEGPAGHNIGFLGSLVAKRNHVQRFGF